MVLPLVVAVCIHASSTSLLIDLFHDSTKVKGDQDFIHKSRVPTDHFQQSLPHLPIPKLQDTLHRYILAQAPVQTAEEHMTTATAVNNFLKGEGAGK